MPWFWKKALIVFIFRLNCPKCSFTTFLWKCYRSTKLLLPLKISGCASPTIKHYSFFKTFHLKCLTGLWIHPCFDNCSLICTVTLCYVLHIKHIQNSGIFRTLFIQVFAGIFKHYFKGIFTHIEALLRLIQTYSARCVTLVYSQPYHILNLGIFRTGCIFNTL